MLKVTGVKKIVVVTNARIPYANNIADGPGYRLWSLLSALKTHFSITVLSLYESLYEGLRKENDVEENRINIRCIPYKPTYVAGAIRSETPDVLIFTPWSSIIFASAYQKFTPSIIDYVGPSIMENLLYAKVNPNFLLSYELKSFWYGDFFTTTNERLRYYLLGMFTASKRILQYSRKQGDPIIHVIPMTPQSEPPIASKTISRQNEEFTIVLAGALLPWYDYDTLLNALYLLKKKTTKFKLVIMGGNIRTIKFDGLSIIKSMMTRYELKDNIEITGLVPFKERAKYYLQSDVGLSLNLNTLENELSTRTRIIDYLWGKMPVITAGGDELSELVVKNRCGLSYKFGDPHDLFRIFSYLIDNRDILAKYKVNIEHLLSEKLNTSKVIAPLLAFLDNPRVCAYRRTPFSASTLIGGYLHYIKNKQYKHR